MKRTHGESHPTTVEFRTWLNMRQRCENPKDKAFKHYGARGIKVCERWQSFANFLADMGRRPDWATSIERVKNNKGYSPANCKWGTRTMQNNNSRRNHKLTINGRTLTIFQWAYLFGIKPKTLWMRVKRGWPKNRLLGKVRK